MQSLILLFHKDMLHEFRTWTAVTFIVSLSLILSVVLAVGINSAFLSQQEVLKIFPCLIWIVFFLTATIVLGKSFDSEIEHRALDGLLLAGVSPSNIYLSKVASGFIVSILGYAFSFFSLAILLNVAVLQVLGSIFLVSVLVLFAYSALACLTVPISNNTKVNALLLPLILLPLLFPLFFAAIELSFDIFNAGYVDLSSIWVSLLLGLDMIYIVLGLNLYAFVIRE